MIKYLYIAAGGATGTLLRYYISGLAHKIGTGIFPWGTVAVNLIGALLIGLSWGLFDRITIPANNRLFLFIGLFGGFTTFSTFAFETFNLIKDNNIFTALVYLLVSNLGGIILVFLGYMLSKLILQTIK